MKTILCYGDSNTYGFSPEDGGRYPEHIRWAGRLKMMLKDEYKVYEQGLNGRTTVYDDPDESGRNGLTTLLPTLMCYEMVDIVILMIGTNDLRLCFDPTEEKLRNNVAKIVDEINGYYSKIYKQTPRIILMAPPEIGVWPGSTDSHDYWDFVISTSKRFPDIYKEIADEKGTDYFNTQTVVTPSEIDNIHLSADSHKALAAALYEKIRSE